MVSKIPVLIRRCAATLQRHHVAHAALACIYGARTVILTVEAAYAHAICAAAAALV